MRTVFLIGFMGAGKTTVGTILGEKLKIPVYDTDREIMLEQKRAISDIFFEKGEAFFRELEANMVKRMPRSDAVVSTGGGVILLEESRRWMKENGTAVFLDAPAEEILTRLSKDESRPLLSGDKEKEISERLAARMPLYLEAADIHIPVSGRTPTEIACEIIQSLEVIENGHTG